MSEFQYQSSTKWWCHHWLRLNLLKLKSFLGIISKAFPTKFHQIWIAKSKVIHVQIQYQNGRKREKGKIFSGLRNVAIRELQIGARGITNRDSFKDFKLGQAFKLGKRDFKSGQEGFQIGTGIANRDRNYKLVQKESSLIPDNAVFFIWNNNFRLGLSCS